MTVDPTAPPARSDDLDFAVAAAREAGDSTLKWFRSRDLEVGTKGDGTPVTEADRTAEALIRDRLARTFPDDGIIGEEHGNRTSRSGRTWVVDPIDGTKAFTQGVPLYATLVSLVDGHGPAVGVIHLPALGETVSAGRGHGARHDDQPCRVSEISTLGDSYVCTSGFSYWDDEPLARMLSSGVKLRTWGDAYGYALVATGRAEAMIDPMCSEWDIAAIAVVVREAGGTFTDRSGDPSWRKGSGVGTNGLVHEAVLGWLAD